MINKAMLWICWLTNAVGQIPLCGPGWDVCVSRVWTRSSSLGRKLEKDECSPLTPVLEVRWACHDVQLLQRQFPLPGWLSPAPVQRVAPAPLIPRVIRSPWVPGPKHRHSDHHPLLPLLLLPHHLPLTLRHGHGRPGVWPLQPLDIWSYFCALQHKWTWAETSKVHTVYNRLETTSCTLWLFSHQLGLVTLRTITIYTLSIEQILKHGYPFRKLNSTGVCKEDG